MAIHETRRNCFEDVCTTTTAIVGAAALVGVCVIGWPIFTERTELFGEAMRCCELFHQNVTQIDICDTVLTSLSQYTITTLCDSGMKMYGARLTGLARALGFSCLGAIGLFIGGCIASRPIKQRVIDGCTAVRRRCQYDKIRSETKIHQETL